MTQQREYSLQELKQAELRQREQGEELESLREVVARIARQRRKYLIPQVKRSNTLRLGICSDLHCGSLYARLDAFVQFLRLCESERVDRVLVAGDIMEGWRVYKGQEFELHAHGYTRQLEAMRNTIPRVRVPVDFITGNHDMSFKKEVGAAVGDSIQQALSGWAWRGDESAELDFRVGGKLLRVGLSHPGGTGSSYALSYRPQKIAEALPGGRKPHLLAIGHYHKAEFVPQYRNIALLQCGAFQSQTPFMANKGLAAHVGGWLVEITVGSGKSLVQRARAEFVSFYEPQEA